MKKVNFILAFSLPIATMLCTVISSTAQGLYAKVGGGYSFSAGQVSMGTKASYDAQRGETTTSTVGGTLGKGVNTKLAVGYMLNKYLGFEVNASYLIGINTVVEQEVSGYTSTTATQASTFALAPAFRFAAPINDKLLLYSTIGILLPLASKKMTMEEATYDINTGIYSTIPFERITETTGYFRVGCATAIGASYYLNNRLGLFAELNINVSSFEAKKSKITKYFSNNEDFLPYLTVRDIETEYLKEYTNNSSSSDRDKPKQQASVITPASSIGVMIGVCVRF
jgi:opacity protein-like surface antigen